MESRGLRRSSPTPATACVIEAVTEMLADPETYGAIPAVSARQLFYGLVKLGMLEKSEAAYQNLVGMLTFALRARMIPFDRITEAKPRKVFPYFDSKTDNAIDRARAILRGKQYHFEPQEDQRERLVIWTETVGMVDVLEALAKRFGIGVVSGGGQPSLTFTHVMSLRLAGAAERARILVVGDYDPGNARIIKTVGEDIVTFAQDFGCEVTVDTIAVTPAQIASMGLITGTKMATQAEAKTWPGIEGDGVSTVQAEAIPPNELVALVTDAVNRHTKPGYRSSLQDSKNRHTAVKKGARQHLDAREDQTMVPKALYSQARTLAASGLSRRAIAKRLGVSYPTVDQWLT